MFKNIFKTNKPTRFVDNNSNNSYNYNNNKLKNIQLKPTKL